MKIKKVAQKNKKNFDESRYVGGLSKILDNSKIDMKLPNRLFTNLVTSTLPNFGSGINILFFALDFLIF